MMYRTLNTAPYVVRWLESELERLGIDSTVYCPAVLSLLADSPCSDAAAATGAAAAGGGDSVCCCGDDTSGGVLPPHKVDWWCAAAHCDPATHAIESRRRRVLACLSGATSYRHQHHYQQQQLAAPLYQLAAELVAVVGKLSGLPPDHQHPPAADQQQQQQQQQQFGYDTDPKTGCAALYSVECDLSEDPLSAVWPRSQLPPLALSQLPTHPDTHAQPYPHTNTYPHTQLPPAPPLPTVNHTATLTRSPASGHHNGSDAGYWWPPAAAALTAPLGAPNSCNHHQQQQQQHDGGSSSGTVWSPTPAASTHFRPISVQPVSASCSHHCLRPVHRCSCSCCRCWWRLDSTVDTPETQLLLTGPLTPPPPLPPPPLGPGPCSAFARVVSTCLIDRAGPAAPGVDWRPLYMRGTVRQHPRTPPPPPAEVWQCGATNSGSSRRPLYERGPAGACAAAGAGRVLCPGPTEYPALRYNMAGPSAAAVTAVTFCAPLVTAAAGGADTPAAAAVYSSVDDQAWAHLNLLANASLANLSALYSPLGTPAAAHCQPHNNNTNSTNSTNNNSSSGCRGDGIGERLLNNNHHLVHRNSDDNDGANYCKYDDSNNNHNHGDDDYVDVDEDENDGEDDDDWRLIELCFAVTLHGVQQLACSEAAGGQLSSSHSAGTAAAAAVTGSSCAATNSCAAAEADSSCNSSVADASSCSSVDVSSCSSDDTSSCSSVDTSSCSSDDTSSCSSIDISSCSSDDTSSCRSSSSCSVDVSSSGSSTPATGDSHSSGCGSDAATDDLHSLSPLTPPPPPLPLSPPSPSLSDHPDDTVWNVFDFEHLARPASATVAISGSCCDEQCQWPRTADGSSGGSSGGGVWDTAADTSYCPLNLCRATCDRLLAQCCAADVAEDDTLWRDVCALNALLTRSASPSTPAAPTTPTAADDDVVAAADGGGTATINIDGCLVECQSTFNNNNSDSSNNIQCSAGVGGGPACESAAPSDGGSGNHHHTGSHCQRQLAWEFIDERNVINKKCGDICCAIASELTAARSPLNSGGGSSDSLLSSGSSSDGGGGGGSNDNSSYMYDVVAMIEQLLTPFGAECQEQQLAHDKHSAAASAKRVRGSWRRHRSLSVAAATTGAGGSSGSTALFSDSAAAASWFQAPVGHSGATAAAAGGATGADKRHRRRHHSRAEGVRVLSENGARRP